MAVEKVPIGETCGESSWVTYGVTYGKTWKRRERDIVLGKNAYRWKNLEKSLVCERSKSSSSLCQLKKL
jgi:hypothetical protein